MTDFEFPGELRPAPAGVSLAITEIWNKGLIGAWDGSSLTDPHEDMPVIEIHRSKLHDLAAIEGEQRVNFTAVANLEKLSDAAALSIAVAFDPANHKNAPLLFQTNLKSAPVVEASYRTDILPRYPYLYENKDEYELWFLIQLRDRTTTWQYYQGDFQEFSEFPRIGPMAIKKVLVRFVE
ncbi:hypothetical protein [Methanoregula sp.]|jgi:hypothetical protein|uniref:hypothetical protein n=1 Tax=Methanoregula sp. TaxID=2052170 RepID=UPI0035682F6A